MASCGCFASLNTIHGSQSSWVRNSVPLGPIGLEGKIPMSPASTTSGAYFSK